MPRAVVATAPSSVDSASDDDQGSQRHDSLQPMIKKLVRLALATDYARQPLRRQDISVKVLNSSRAFNRVFAGAQTILQDTYGMRLVELPAKERVTIAQKRAGLQSQSIASSKAYILTSTLPARLRTPKILIPPRAPSHEAEAAFTGLASWVVALTYLSHGGRISEGKLERYLSRCNADRYVLGEKTEVIIKRLERQGYIVAVREREAGGEETLDYIVGPRGKVEIGVRGVAGMVRTVYGKRGSDAEELEDCLQRSLGSDFVKRRRRAPSQEEALNHETTSSQSRAQEDGGG